MDMNLIYSVGLIIVGVLAGYFIPKLKISKNLEDKVDSGFKIADTTIEVAKTILPNNKAVNIVDFIEKRAELAVHNSEQAYHNGDIKTNEERFSVAQDYVLNTLKIMGITPTAEMRQQIGNAVQGYVNQLGHAPATEAEKTAQLLKVQQDLAATQAENTQLKQTINTIQTAAQTVQTGQATKDTQAAAQPNTAQ